MSRSPRPAVPAESPPREKYRRRLETLRNRALLYALADSGARVSEILRVTADDVRGARLNRQGIWPVEVRGKGRGHYGRLVTLRFTRPTLLVMREYLRQRRRFCVGSSDPLSQRVSRHYVTCMPSAVQRATVPPQKNSGSSGWGSTTSTRSGAPGVIPRPSWPFRSRTRRSRVDRTGSGPSTGAP